MEKPPKTNFEFEDTFQVWKVLKPSASSLLLIELRNGTELETVFVCIDLATNKIIWDDLSFENSWAFSMSEVDNSNIYFTEFEDGEIPEAKAVMAVSILNKEILWYKEGVILEGVINNEVILGSKSTEQNTKLVVDAENGELLEKEIPSRAMQPINAQMQLPYGYKEKSAHFDTVKLFLKEKFDTDIVRSCDYLEFNSYIIVGFYTLNEENKLANYIFLLDNKGTLLHKELIGDNLEGIASETFFIAEEYLIYIKHKKEIVTFYLKN